nr:hypothetical protein GCM10020093_002660 [Planobispora longispora]
MTGGGTTGVDVMDVDVMDVDVMGGGVTGVGDLIPYIAGALVIGGIAVALSRRREYILRWCVWAVAVPVVIAILHAGPGGAAALAAAVGVVCAAEYGLLTRLPRPDRVMLATAVAALPVTAWLAPAQSPRVFGGAVLSVALVPLFAGDAAGGLKRLCLGVLGVVWFAPLIGVVLLGPAALALFAAVSVADITASFGGRLLGGPRLSPLSPAKHWSGVLTGTAAGLGCWRCWTRSPPPWRRQRRSAPRWATCWSRWSSGAPRSRTRPPGWWAREGCWTGSTPPARPRPGPAAQPRLMNRRYSRGRSPAGGCADRGSGG